MARRLVAWGPTLAYMACIFAASSLPSPLERTAGAYYFEGLDKLPHAAEYGLLCLNVYSCRPRTPPDWERFLADELGATDVVVRELSRGLSEAAVLPRATPLGGAGL